MGNQEGKFYQPFLSKEAPALILIKTQQNGGCVVVSMRQFVGYTSVHQLNEQFVEVKMIFKQGVQGVENFAAVIAFSGRPKNIYFDRPLEEIKPGGGLTIHIRSGNVEPIELTFHAISEVVVKYAEEGGNT